MRATTYRQCTPVSVDATLTTAEAMNLWLEHKAEKSIAERLRRPDLGICADCKYTELIFSHLWQHKSDKTHADLTL